MSSPKRFRASRIPRSQPKKKRKRRIDRSWVWDGGTDVSARARCCGPIERKKWNRAMAARKERIRRGKVIRKWKALLHGGSRKPVVGLRTFQIPDPRLYDPQIP